MSVIFNKYINSSISLCVWHITETEEFLFEDLPLSRQDILYIKKMKLEKRRKEMLACRQALLYLLKEMNLEIDLPLKITYSETGAPRMDRYHLSFSHSKEYVAVAISTEQPIGIDIEIMGSKIEKLYPRFMNKQEISEANIACAEELHYYWSTKEAMIKLHGEGNMDFLNDIHVPRINFVSEKPCHYKDFLQAKLYHWQIKNCCLVLAVKI
ncbi:MAG: 4'-phosphopantetheinyl transferase superfamily protein [Bacteroidales bacterium]